MGGVAPAPGFVARPPEMLVFVIAEHRGGAEFARAAHDAHRIGPPIEQVAHEHQAVEAWPQLHQPQELVEFLQTPVHVADDDGAHAHAGQNSSDSPSDSPALLR